MNVPTYQELVAFVQHMARMTTPYDPEQVARFKDEYPQFEDLDGQELRDEIYGEYPGDNAIEEASAFWQLIEEARTLTGINQQAERSETSGDTS